jgi:hypothetical protein
MKKTKKNPIRKFSKRADFSTEEIGKKTRIVKPRKRVEKKRVLSIDTFYGRFEKLIKIINALWSLIKLIAELRELFVK